MLSIRVTDNAQIESVHGEKIIFEEANRKGNIVKKFKLNGNDVSFFDEVLNVKMIPKQSQEEINSHPICVVETEGPSIVFQSIASHVKFIRINDDGFFELVDFCDLSPNDDEILMYDELTEDYVLIPVSDVYIVNEIDPEDNPLSNYVLLSENGGIVINGIMVIS